MKLIFLAFVAFTYSVASAQAGLLRGDGAAAVAVDTSTRQARSALPLCARHLNFWCLKTPGNDRWLGQTGQDGKNHAIFDDPEFGARAFFRLMRTYRFRHGLTTTNQILGRFAPASDCIGSLARDPATGTCPRGENPTWVYARNIAAALGLGPDDPIGLFLDETTVNRAVALELARAMARFELGPDYSVSADLVDAGLRRAGFTVAD